MPSFVYYSNYGNLDSEIYLPHVIENLKRKGLGTKEEAKARTLNPSAADYERHLRPAVRNAAERFVQRTRRKKVYRTDLKKVARAM